MAYLDVKAVRRETRTFAGQTVPVAVVPRFRAQPAPAGIATALKGLLAGMALTLRYLSNPWKVVTRPYPENRNTLRFPERYRANLRLKHLASDAEELRVERLKAMAARLHCDPQELEASLREQEQTWYHKCTACGNCEAACPNGSIRILTRIGEITEERELDRFIWRMDSCTFCNACVQACPFDALEMGPHFENAVYDRRLLIYNLNRYAGPAASVVFDEEDPEVRAKLTEPRDIYGGPVPLNGHPLPNIRPVVPAADEADPAAAVPGRTREAEA